MSVYSSTSNESYMAAYGDQNAEWYSLASLRILLRALKVADFKQVSGRTAAMAALTSLITVQPYSIVDGVLNTVALRFGTSTNAGVPLPATIYVAAFCDGWEEAFANLRLAIDSPTRQMNNTTTDNANGSEVDQSASTPDPRQAMVATNDATVAYNRGISKITQLLRNQIAFHNYHSFEAKYNLIWSAAVQPGPHSGSPELPLRDLTRDQRLVEALHRLHDTMLADPTGRVQDDIDPRILDAIRQLKVIDESAPRAPQNKNPTTSTKWTVDDK